MVRKGWKQVTLGDIALFQGGSQPPLSFFSSQKKAGYIRLVQIRDYKTDKYATYIPEKLAKRFCKQDDIMIGRYGPPIFQILRGIEGAYNVALIKALPQGVDKEFLYHTLKREDLFQYIDLLSRRTSGQTGVDLTNLKAFELSIPVLTDEQTAIAKALSDVDSLIVSLQRLIEKKKAIKQGAMQELLAGKKRMTGFHKEWSYQSLETLGELSREVINPQLFPGTSFYEYSMPAYDDGKRPKKTQGQSMHSARLKICGEVILFNKLNVRQRRVWHVKDCLENAVCSSEFLPYHALEVLPEFLYQVLMNDKTTNDFENMSTGTSNSQKRITPDDFLGYQIFLPAKDEQRAIAQVLSDMDSEIEQLEKKLTKYKQIKQGMMQELLTGRIRLV